MAGYAICTEARSGSNYLNLLLTSTGVLGRPREFFNAESFQGPEFVGYPQDPKEQLALIPTLGATPNGVYGLKLFAGHFDSAKATRWALALPDLSFVHLERRDFLGQAISQARAVQTNQWTFRGMAQAEPTYSGEQINGELVGILRSQTRWRYYFARNGIAPLHLAYEDLVSAPQDAVEAIGRLVGLVETPRINFEAFDLKIQRDALNEEWRHRYITEFGDLAAFY